MKKDASKNKVLIVTTLHGEKRLLENFIQCLLSIESEYVIEFYIIKHDDKKNIDELINLVESKFKTFVFLNSDRSSYGTITSKDKALEYVIKNDYKYVVYIDSLIIFHPNLIDFLIKYNKDIISELLWEDKNGSLTSLMPYNMELNDNIYKIEDVGEILVISRKAIEKGVCFKSLNFKIDSENKYFALRAEALGIDMYLDTKFPAMKIDNIELLDYIQLFKNKNYKLQYEDRMTIKRCNEIKKISKEFLMEYLNIDYRIVTGLEGIEFASEKYKNIMLMNKTKVKDYIKSNKIIKEIEEFHFQDIKLIGESARISIIVKFKDEEAIYNFYIDMIKEENYYIENIRCKKNQKYLIGNTLNIILEEKERTLGEKLTLATIINEDDNILLEKHLNSIIDYIDEAVIIFTGRYDKNRKNQGICTSIFEKHKKNLYILYNNASENSDSIEKQLWEYCVSINPQWILRLDCDEIIYNLTKEKLTSILKDEFVDNYAFEIYDMWNDESYREDQYWSQHLRSKVVLTRLQKNVLYNWDQYLGVISRFPVEIFQLETALCNVRIKHLGFSTRELRVNKYEKYKKYHNEWISIEQEDSILRENVMLKKF